VSPEFIKSTSGSNVTLVGQNFYENATVARCVFSTSKGIDTTIPQFINSNQVVCPTPVLNATEVVQFWFQNVYNASSRVASSATFNLTFYGKL
jgi:hypothetical protein